MQPFFTPAKQVNDSVSLLSILTADLSFEYMDASFQFKYFSNDSSFIRHENGERLRLHPDFNFWAMRNFFGQESHRPLQVRRCPYAYVRCDQFSCCYNPGACVAFTKMAAAKKHHQRIVELPGLPRPQ